jgi:hypothetical protein
MPQQNCPEVESIQPLIKRLMSAPVEENDENARVIENDDLESAVLALDWLQTFLLNRRNYQRKQQIKKKIMQRIITEHDLNSVLDENIKHEYGDHLEKFDDNNADD